MTLYAQSPVMRAKQVTMDVGSVVWAYVWIRVGMWLHDLIAALAAPGRLLEDSGARLANGLESAGRRAADVPLVGNALSAPFDTAAGAGRAMEQAGAAQQDAVLTLALAIGLLVALLPIAYVLARYLPGRVRWVREATAARGIWMSAGDLRLFALRAVANRPLTQLRRATPDPAGALESGDYAALAALELRSLGFDVAQ